MKKPSKNEDIALSKLRSILVSRSEMWKSRQSNENYLRGLGFTQSEMKYACIGREHECDAIINVIDCLTKGDPVDWAIPSNYIKPEIPEQKLDRYTCRATAEQRAEAFLRTFNKWK